MITITESGMIFGEYAEDDCFEIEKSIVYQNVSQHVKIAEFLLLGSQKNKPVIWIIEAKSSAPKSTNNDDFEKYLGDIADKFLNSLMLMLSIYLKRQSNAAFEALPKNFQKLDLATIGFRFILVINGFPESWLPPLQDALVKKLKTLSKIWQNSKIVVLNENNARDYKLIYTPA